jgi:hypothetical protein
MTVAQRFCSLRAPSLSAHGKNVRQVLASKDGANPPPRRASLGRWAASPEVRCASLPDEYPGQGALRMNAEECAPAEFEGKLKHVDRDLELDFIREFATGGELLKDLSDVNRRERIRVAIYTQKLPHMLFRDGPMTYAEAYAECFGRPLEMRRAVRDQPKSEATES